jgi:hypothetical protein
MMALAKNIGNRCRRFIRAVGAIHFQEQAAVIFNVHEAVHGSA